MSSKRIIAVDFDDVIVQTGLHFLEFSDREYGKTIHPKHLYSPTFEAWNIPSKEFERRVINFHTTEQRHNLQLVTGVGDALAVLSKSAELHIVTGRPPSLTEVTHEIVDYYFPDIFASISFTNIFSGQPTPKAEVCKRIGATLLIDDHIGHAQEVAAEGIDVLLFGDHPWNQTSELPANIRRVNGWDEVLKIVKETK